MPEKFTLRSGLPKFAAKIAAGQAATIVAFGTSMTLHSRGGMRIGARYLDALMPSLRDVARNDRITLHCKGLEGFNSLWAAYRTRSDVLPLKPDLVLLEFAHNDTAEAMQSMIPYAMHAIVAQIREAFPECEVAIVILQPIGAESSGAVRAHEAIADYYGFPSFDLIALSERLASEGHVLTFDGTHHSDSAAELLGRPFAEAFIELLRESSALQPRVVPTPDELCGDELCNLDYLPLSRMVRDLRRARRAPAASFAGRGWTTAPADAEHERTRNAAGYVDDIAHAQEIGASLTIGFHGTHALAWALETGGALRVEVDGRGHDLQLSAREPQTWYAFPLTPDLHDGEHAVTVRVTALPVVLGDIYVIGELPQA